MELNEMLSTFKDNKAFRKILPKLIETHIETTRENTRRLLAAQDLYKKNAAEYYRKHGTVGEF
jgi:hypothetical protein